MIRILICTALLLTCTIVTATHAQVLFFENWDDGMGASRWSDPIAALEDPTIGFDGSVNYAYDYSVLGIAPAPNTIGGSTIGAAMETNTTRQEDMDGNLIDQGESVGIVPLSALATIPDGYFKLTADVYLYWNGGSGSTEYGTLGVYSNGAAVPLRFSLDPGDGLAWQWDSDGDSGTDILRYENPPPLESGLGGYEELDCNVIPNVNTGTPMECMFPGNAIVGPANQWTVMEIENVGGIVAFKMNGYTINTFDNTSGQFSAGTLLIGQSDPFNSVNLPNVDGFSNLAIFDNVTLQVPEPGCAVLISLAGMALLLSRRILN